MAETGVRPAVSPWRRRVLDGVRLLFTPLRPDDYLELIDPLWSTRELRGRVERLEPQADGAVTIHIRPAFTWPGHRPGQYVRIGVVVDGRHHWRAYSLTSPPDAPGGLISITPKCVPDGVLSPYLTRRLRVGDVVRLGEVEGSFTAPDAPGPLLFVTAGSGVTPVISMLRRLDRHGGLGDAVVVHSARTADDVIFGAELRALAGRNPGLRLEVWTSADHGRIGPGDLAELCRDWRDREAYASGPGELLDALTEHWDAHGDADRLHLERFQPVIGTGGGDGEGGSLRFARKGVEAECPSGTSVLVAGEEAGLDMPFGCRMGVCHTCVLRVREGVLRDLRSGDVRTVRDEVTRTCIHGAEGPVEIDF